MIRLSAMILLSLCLSGCSMTKGHENKEKPPPKLLKDIVYRPDAGYDYRVHIPEDGTYTPYLVLSSDDNGSCLLLREHLSEEDHIYNSVAPIAAYYENSAIDRYLNEVFIKAFPPDIRERIAESTIEITDKSSLGIGGTDTCTIKRKIFLLSFTEVNAGYSRTNPEEGTALEYFTDKSSRIARYQDGTAGSWWLRTPNTSAKEIVCGVTKEGIVGIGGIYDPNLSDGYSNGVRPAFCLPNDTRIEQTAIDGTDSFVVNTS